MFARLTAIAFYEKLLKQYDCLLIFTLPQYYQPQPAFHYNTELIIRHSSMEDMSENSSRVHERDTQSMSHSTSQAVRLRVRMSIS